MSFAAMCADISYEGARGITGPYLGYLGASATAIGFAAGLGELLGYGLRFLTGWLADRTRAYFLLTGLGYALTFSAVFGMGIVAGLVGSGTLHNSMGGWQLALLLLLLERVGKAVRSPARSHLVAAAARTIGEGKGFGLDEALDQIGAISGPLLCALVMSIQGGAMLGRYRAAFLVLALPGIFTFSLLLLARRHPPIEPAEPAKPAAAGAAPASSYSRLLRWYLFGVALLAAGFVDWALVGLHISRTHVVPPSYIPLLYAGAMAVDGVAALLLGVLFDRWQAQRGVLALVVGTLVSAAGAPLIFLPLSSDSPQIAILLLVVGVVLWGVGMGAQEAICKAAIARFVPAAQRGRAYGTFYTLYGLSWWLGSTALGALYERWRLLMVTSSVTLLLAAALLLMLVARTTTAATATAGQK